MVELHVHNGDRLRAAAIATGWSPGDPDELPDDDPQDLTGAVMCLTDDLSTVPGADLIALESTGDLLGVDWGDELADWSSEPVEAQFGGRRRLPQSSENDERLPDFFALFPVDEDEDGWQVTPRTASALHAALCVLADEAYDDIDQHGDNPVGDEGYWLTFDRLPRISWRQDATWRRLLARAADDLAGDLECGRWPIPRCNAEELILHLAIEDAEAAVADQEDIESQRDLPEYEDDYDWDMCSQILFQDNDVRLLYENCADGIEDRDGDLNIHLGIGDLRPGNWFTFFNNVEPRDPNRGFRR